MIERIDGAPWRRKHDVAANPVVPSARVKLHPTTLEDLIAICTPGAINLGAPPRRSLKAAGAHWGLSAAALSDDVFIETQDPANQLAGMARTLRTIVPNAMDTELVEYLASAAPTQFDDDTTLGKGCYFFHFETGKRVNQAYAEFDYGEDDVPDSLCSALLARGSENGRGPWAIPTLGGAGGQTVFGALNTGTHGSDHMMPPIADAVVAMHLVLDGGRHLWIEPETPMTIDGLPFVLTDQAKVEAAYLSTAEEKPAKWRRKTLPLRDAGNGGWAG